MTAAKNWNKKNRSNVQFNEKGQDLAEYGILVGFIALVIVGAVVVLGQNLLNFFLNLAATVIRVF